MSENMAKIDSHHHFWRFDPIEYAWIADSMRTIQRDFLPRDLLPELVNAGVDGVVSVQARQSVAETQWLLDLAADHHFIRGVVGWVDLVAPTLDAELARFALNPKLKAVRHVIHDEVDENYILRDDFNRGIRRLKTHLLAYDILVRERHLLQTIDFVDLHPQQVFVLDHIAKPRIKEGELEPWRRNILELARRPNVYCKVSGMVTEADFTTWTEEQLRPYFDVVLDAFGPQRLMFGSDWPVCLVACDYGRWHKLVSGWVDSLTADEQARILGLTAIEAYGL